MPLMKSKSKLALTKKARKEMPATKRPKQAMMMAYGTRGTTAGKRSGKKGS